MNKLLLAVFILLIHSWASANQCFEIFQRSNIPNEYDAAYAELLKPIELLDPAPQPLKTTDIRHQWYGDSTAPGPVVVLIHGLAGSHYTWHEVAPKLHTKTGLRVLIYDQRGHGETKETGLTYTSELLARDLNELFKFYNIQESILVGHSMGGRTAVEFAYLFPEKVRGVFVEDMHMMGRKTVLSYGVNIAIKIKENLSGKVFKTKAEAWSVIEMVFGVEDYQGIKAFARDAVFINKNNEIEIYDRAHVSYLYYAQGLQKDFTRELENIDRPLLFLAATINPVLFGKGIDHIVATQPNAQVVEVPNVDHSIHDIIPSQYVQKIEEFIQFSTKEESP